MRLVQKETKLFNPVNYFQNEEKQLFLAIKEGLETYYTKIDDQNPCYKFFGINKKNPHPLSHQINIMLECKLGEDLLINYRYFFPKNAPYLPYIIRSIDAKVIEHPTNLNLNNVHNFFQSMSEIYSQAEKKREDINQNLDLNKLIKIIDRYKIIFVKEDLDFGSIMTLPIHSSVVLTITPRSLCEILKLVLKAYTVWVNEKSETVHISNSNNKNYLTFLQKQILFHSKEMVKSYFKDKDITILGDQSLFNNIDTDDIDHDTKLTNPTEKIITAKSKQSIEKLKKDFMQDFGHYYINIRFSHSEKEMHYFEFINTVKGDDNSFNFSPCSSTNLRLCRERTNQYALFVSDGLCFNNS